MTKRGPERRGGGDADVVVGLAGDVGTCGVPRARLTGGDLDADWRAADTVGDEAVGGSTATPDQDVVDELGEALGVALPPDAEVVTTGEILAARDRHRWHLERDAMLREEAARVAEEGQP